MGTTNQQTNLDTEVRDQGSQLTGDQLQEVDSHLNQISEYNQQLHGELGEQQSDLNQLDRNSANIAQQFEQSDHQSEHRLESTTARDAEIESSSEQQASQDMDYGY